MIIKYKSKKIEIPARKVSFIGKITGLMFRTKNTGNLLFEFSGKTRMKIHSFFVFFDFLAIWLDDKNNVIESRKIHPFTPSSSPNREFSKLIEAPFNDKNAKITDFFVGDEKQTTLRRRLEERFK